ncbi:MAG: 30S ribosomal protein S20 [Bacilli bacterium]|nr:30S ribosomal protein S20 [Bacilli bacterium]
MPNMKNAKKAVKVIAKKKEANNNFGASMKTAIRNVEKAVLNKDKNKATDALKVAIKRIDKAGAKGIAAKNFVARNKSRLSKKVNEME